MYIHTYIHSVFSTHHYSKGLQCRLYHLPAPARDVGNVQHQPQLVVDVARVLPGKAAQPNPAPGVGEEHGPNGRVQVVVRPEVGGVEAVRLRLVAGNGVARAVLYDGSIGADERVGERHTDGRGPDLGVEDF